MHGLLHSGQRNALSQEHLVDISALAETGYRKHRTFRISVEAMQLARLIDSAAVGWRVYELMSIRRPGDLLNYLTITPVELNPLIEKVIREVNSQAFSRLFPDDKPLPSLPFPKIDQCFAWRGEEDTVDWDIAWCRVRDSGYWKRIILELFPVVQRAQAQLLESSDPLVRRELNLIATFSHPEMLTAEVRRRMNSHPLPPGERILPVALQEYLRELVTRPETLSASCEGGDYHLWRILIDEQLRRAETTGLPPQEAFGLCSADHGIPWLPSDFLGADVHVPYEGICGGDIFFLPRWFKFDAEAAVKAGNLSGGTHGKHCRYLITDRDFGDLSCATRRAFGGWFVYEDKNHLAPCNPFST